jgi:cytochrome c7-like protein
VESRAFDRRRDHEDGERETASGQVHRLAATAAVALLVWAVGAGRAEAQLGALLSPGKLSQPHAQLEGISNCQKCHEQGRRTTPAKCLACHAPIADRMARRVGVHKDVKGDCAVCHSDHAGIDGELRPFDVRQFDHAADAGFPLTGKHATVASQCAACHKVRSFLTLSSGCASCHADVHKGTLGSNCTTCHSTQTAFKDLSGRFDHTKARFNLVGAHRTVACESCHTNKTFRGLAFDSCTDCHRDPHVQKFGPTCATCHTNDSWRTRRVDHTRTSFPLLGRHTTTECAACHKQPAMKVKPRAATCASCHVDVHKGTFTQDCKACHSESGFSKAPFDHSKTRFELTGKHQALTCQKCHTTVSLAARAPASRTADYRGLKTTCVSCHTDVHQAELGSACESCHTSTTFKRATFTHTRQPDFFTGQHAPVACDRCHVPDPPTTPARTGAQVLAIKFTRATTTCATCHADVHLGQVGTQCEACHTVTTANFAVSGFAHDTRTAFPLAGRHATVTCAACHKVETARFPAGKGTARRLTGVPAECRACHADVHLGQLGVRCETCHQPTSFTLEAYRHQNATPAAFFAGRHVRATCEACHKPVTARFPSGEGTAVQFSVDRSCVSCHRDVHRGALGPDCARCHKP